MKAYTRARKPERVVIPFPTSKADPEPTDAVMRTPKSAIWGWLELGFLVTLASSVLVSMFQVLVVAGNLAE
jgi:hypothetical protein